MSAWTDSTVAIESDGEHLLGVASVPERPGSTGVIVIVGGPQYRAGSHRQFVLLARYLAAAGVAVLRFDLRGMGDSSGEPRSFEDCSADISAAIDSFMGRVPALRRVVLWGLCDGASAALLYLQGRSDARVGGLCLLNPWVRSAATQAATQVRHYYLDRLRTPAFWRKLLSGGVAASAAVELWGSLLTMLASRRAHRARPASVLTYQQRMASAWMAFGGPLLLVLSGNDHTAREFEEACATQPEWRHALGRARVTRVDVLAADHTFTANEARSAAERALLDWLRAVQPAPELCT
jgi:exosortase A-associated hydrolase 1